MWVGVLLLSATLTFLQLSEPVVVLEESLTAEGVCEQDLREQAEKQHFREADAGLFTVRFQSRLRLCCSDKTG